MFSELISKVFNFITLLLLIKTVTPEEYGVYSYVISISSIIIIFSDLGFSWFSFNHSVKNESAMALQKIISLKAILSLALIFIAPLLFVNKKELFWVFLLVLATIIISAFNRNILMIHRAKQNTFEDNILILFEPTLRIIVMIILSNALEDISVELVCLGFLAIGVLSLLVNFLVSKKLHLHFQQLDISETIILLKKTSPFFLYYLFHVSIVRVDTILLEKFANLKGVAQYNVSFTILLTIVMVINAATSSNFARVLKLTPLKLTQIVLLLSVPTIFFTRLFSDQIFSFIFPEEYALSSQIINVLIFSIPITTTHFWLAIRNNYYNKTNQNIIVYFSVLMLKIGLLIYLKPSDPLIFSKIYLLFESITLILMLYLTKTKK